MDLLFRLAIMIKNGKQKESQAVLNMIQIKEFLETIIYLIDKIGKIIDFRAQKLFTEQHKNTNYNIINHGVI